MKKQHRLSHKDAVRYGKMGGSPVLLALKLHHPVKGYKVTKVGK
jgi:hypothetical protein